MKIIQSAIPDVIIIEPKVFKDPRGFFLETWNSSHYTKAGITSAFVQDNLSKSIRGVLRGLHLQHPYGQDKLVQVIDGEVFDVAVDVRVNSPTFGQWISEILSGTNHRQMYIPVGFAHGFCVTSESALFSYKCTKPYSPEMECGIRWNDPTLNIPWPITKPIVSEKDNNYPFFQDIPLSKFPND